MTGPIGVYIWLKKRKFCSTIFLFHGQRQALQLVLYTAGSLIIHNKQY